MSGLCSEFEYTKGRIREGICLIEPKYRSEVPSYAMQNPKGGQPLCEAAADLNLQRPGLTEEELIVPIAACQIHCTRHPEYVELRTG